MKRRQAISTMAALVLPASVSSQPAPGERAVEKSTADALRKFDEIKFGMFIHWGLYAIPAGEWKGQYHRWIGEWIMNRARIPVEEYAQLAAKFNPIKFNADEWAQVAQDAGMRYMVITSKHHDGFAMYGSKASKYNIVDATPYGKDPMKPLSAACAKRGIGFGFYYSQDQDWHERNGRGNDWDFPAERNPQEYLEGKVFPQVKEILTGYGQLSLIWFDTPGMLSKQQVTDLRRTVKTLQPRCLLNSRIGYDKGDYFQTGDNAIPIQVYSKTKWEVPATLNDTWGFKKKDQNWKDPADLIAKLADIVSKGGNYLLNVGPTAEGVIPEASQRILRTIGKWLSVNGESIYGTSRSPFYFPGITWRCTVKPGKVYLHIINWPGEKLRLEGLESKVKRAYFLANRTAVPFKQDGIVLSFELPPQPVDPYNTVLVLEIADTVPRVARAFASDNLPDRLDLYSWTARLSGEDLRYDKKSASVTNFKKAATNPNQLQWWPYESLNGRYGIELTYACNEVNAGSSFRVGLQKTYRGDPEESLHGRIESTKGEFVTRPVEGTLRVEDADQYISFELPDDEKSADVRVQKITLVKRGG